MPLPRTIGTGRALMGRAQAAVAPTYTQKVVAFAPLAYWPFAEPSGSVAADESGNARNGAYSAVTLAQTGIGDGRTAALFNGATSVCNVFTAGLQGAFNKDEGTVATWFKIGAGGWADGNVPTLVNFGADANNRVTWFKNGAGQVTLRYTAGGTAKNVSQSPVTLGFLHLAITWSKANDQVIGYFAGVAQGAPQTGLGSWVGALASTLTVVGAANSAAGGPASGTFAHPAVWTSPLSAATILSLATVA